MRKRGPLHESRMKGRRSAEENEDEGPAVQLNCYDIIRGDPSGTAVVVLLKVVMSMVVLVVKRRAKRASEGER